MDEIKRKKILVLVQATTSNLNHDPLKHQESFPNQKIPAYKNGRDIIYVNNPTPSLFPNSR